MKKENNEYNNSRANKLNSYISKNIYMKHSSLIENSKTSFLKGLENIDESNSIKLESSIPLDSEQLKKEYEDESDNESIKNERELLENIDLLETIYKTKSNQNFLISLNERKCLDTVSSENSSSNKSNLNSMNQNDLRITLEQKEMTDNNKSIKSLQNIFRVWKDKYNRKKFNFNPSEIPEPESLIIEKHLGFLNKTDIQNNNTSTREKIETTDTFLNLNNFDNIINNIKIIPCEEINKESNDLVKPICKNESQSLEMSNINKDHINHSDSFNSSINIIKGINKKFTDDTELKCENINTNSIIENTNYKIQECKSRLVSKSVESSCRDNKILKQATSNQSPLNLNVPNININENSNLTTKCDFCCQLKKEVLKLRKEKMNLKLYMGKTKKEMEFKIEENYKLLSDLKEKERKMEHDTAYILKQEMEISRLNDILNNFNNFFNDFQKTQYVDDKLAQILPSVNRKFKTSNDYSSPSQIDKSSVRTFNSHLVDRKSNHNYPLNNDYMAENFYSKSNNSKLTSTHQESSRNSKKNFSKIIKNHVNK